MKAKNQNRRGGNEKHDIKKVGKGDGNKKKTGKNVRQKKGQWNLVPVGEEFFSDKEFENLISFEELTSYDVVTAPDGTKEILSGGNNDTVDVTENGTTNQKRKKTKAAVGNEKENPKRQKTSREKREKDFDNLGASSGEVINTSAGVVLVEDDELQQKVQPDSNDADNKASLKSKRNKQKRSQGKMNKEEIKDTLEQCDDDGFPNNDTTNDAPDIDFTRSEWAKLGVREIITKALLEKNFNTPTTIQALTLPAAIMGKKDIVGAAETGSGKTLAFAIPIIDGILKSRSRSDRKDQSEIKDGDEDDNSSDGEEASSRPLASLILTPTRELAVQIKNHFDVAAKYAEINTVVIVGGLALQKQERLLRGKPDVVIATPGRLWELVQTGDPHLSTLNQLKYLAIDETDRMVEKGHFQELQGILSYLNKDEVWKNRRQNFIFSATLAFTHEPPQRFKKMGKKTIKNSSKKVSAKEKLKQIMEMVGIRPKAKIVDITSSKGTCETLVETQITCSQDHKDYYLYYFLLSHPGRTIVFCNSINCVRRLTNLFFLLQCGEVLPLHSEMHQKQRLRNLERFTANERGVLIATDVAARGLDIQNIEHVIHYQVPKTAESYIHRSGRTARAFKGGLAILMIEPTETTTVKNIFRSLGREDKLPNFEVDEAAFREYKSTVETAVKVEKFEHSIRKKLADHNWMEKAKKEMDLASSSEESDDETGNGSQKKSLMKAKKQLEDYKKQLSQMLVSNTNTAILKKQIY